MRGNGLPKDVPENLLMLFRDYIEEHGGIRIEPEKFDSLRISIHARATRCGYRTYEDYYDYLLRSEDEFKQLISLVAINETYFFRYPEQFRILREYVVPQIEKFNKHKKQKFMRVWSAGCSTGEEPYSIAISLYESLPDIDKWNIYILGTDVSVKALEKAKKGLYKRGSFRITDDFFLKKYFRKVSSDTWEVIPEIRNMVHFAYHNLIKEPYPLAFFELWDIIFCRNVTIYFKPDSTKRVVENLFRSLRPGGFLFTGHTETLYHINPGFEVIKFGDAFIFRKPEETDKKVTFTAKKGFAEAKKEKKDTKKRAEDSLQLVENLLEIVQKKIEVEPEERKEIYREVIYKLLDEGNIRDAILKIEEAVKSFPLEAEFHYLKGIAHKKKEDLKEAEHCFRKAAFLDPSFVYAIIELASILAMEGKIEEAIKQYKKALKSLNLLQYDDDIKKEEQELLIRICEMMIKDLERREARRDDKKDFGS